LKLLLDENLSRRIVPFLQNDFPETTHVALVALEAASDNEVWSFAKLNDFVIVTKDADFYELSLTNNDNAPKVVWLRILNTSKNEVLKLLLNHHIFIKEQLENKNKVCVEII
jgi:predicted nuclease of predicted toxin-antitoxin system